MRRFGVIVALGALLGMFTGVVTASPALAGRGPKWELLQAEPFTISAVDCGFEINAVPVANEYQKVLKASDGSIIFLATGSLKVSLTNAQTGKTITENASGPSKTTAFPDGSVAFASRGHTLAFFPSALAQQFGLPPVSVTAGQLNGAFDSDGNLTALSLGGHVLVDVCAALS